VRPLRLKLKGLRSYLAEQEVDFTRAGLVAVVGDTGAGKSSLLEAICFALYGSATWSAREVKDLISDRAETLRVQFEFLADGRRWQVTRATSTGSYPPPIHELRCLDNPGFHVDKATEVTRWIEKLIGLDYSAFLRAVVLPQGRFQELLQATATDRTKILKGIFRLDLLEAMREICDRLHAENRERIHRLDLELAGMLPDPPGTLERKGEEAARANDAMERLQSACREIQAQLDLAAELEKSAERLLASVAPLREALAARPAERAMELCERAAPFLEKERSLEEQRAGAARTCEEIAQRIARAEESGLGAAGLASCEKEIEELKRSMAGSSSSEGEIAAREAQMDALRQTSDRQTEELRRLQAELEAATEQLAAQRQNHSLVLEKANQAQMRLQVARDREREERDAFETARRISIELSSRSEERDALLRAAHAHEEECARAREALEHLRREHAAAHVSAGCIAGDPCPVCQRKLPAGFRPPPVPEESAAIEAVARAEMRARVSVNALATLEGMIGQLAAQCEEQNATVGAARTRAQQARAQLEALLPLRKHRAAVTRNRSAQVSIELATDAPSIDIDVETAVQALATELPDLKAVEAAVEAKREAREAAQELLRRTQASLQSARAIQSEADAALARSRANSHERWRKLLKLLGSSATAMDEASVDRIAAILAGSRQAFESLQREEREARRSLERIRQEEMAHRNRQESELTRPLLALGGELSILQERIGRAMKVRDGSEDRSRASRASKNGSKRRTDGSEDRSPEELLPESTHPGDLVNWATNLEARARSLEKALGAEASAHSAEARQARRAAWQKHLAETPLTETSEGESATSSAPRPASIPEPTGVELDAAVRAGLQSMQHALQEASFLYRSAQREVELAQSQLPRWTSLRAALDQGRPVVEAIAELTRLLSDGKFIGHVVRRQQRGLLAIASELLRDMSGGRFGFAESFEVVDLLTGQVRNVKTLSGGETFLASLALALGLVELAGRSGGRLDALFLDEGFGSLDANCLAEALDALSRQAEGGRLVVVISHLQAVAESIDDVLLVTRDDTGSRARWLHAKERETLVLNDAGNGLLL
jgi:exonuclease SbcC